jgi:hypothetical protein
MKIGFTGTQQGLTPRQLGIVYERIVALKPDVLLHGGCIGADDEVDELASTLGIERHVYPSTIEVKRVPNSVLLARTGSRAVIMPPASPLVRNRYIVEHCSVLLACPGGREELLRSGTWATIRHARRNKHVTLTIVYP